MAPRLAEISEHLVADPRRSGGSMFRIYRDTRFSKDKTPYKTHAAVQFRHIRGKDVHAPGFYFHAGPREVFLGAGIWRPDAGALARIRTAIDRHPDEWLRARDHEPFRTRLHLSGESLKRAPKGYPADHPLVDDLKRKDFIGVLEMAPPALINPNLIDETVRSYAVSKPFMRFLCDALDLPF